MARQRKHRFQQAALLVALLFSRSSMSATPDILLPEPFAIELPTGASTIAADDAAVTQLLGRVEAGGDRVSVSLPREQIGPGAWRVILSAWTSDIRDRLAARREAVLIVLPHGMTPVANTGLDSTPRIVRDADGYLHMVWTDAWRAGAREGAMYRRGVVLPDGTVRFATEILDLARNRGNWTAKPILTAVGNVVHFIWQADGTIRYRSLNGADGDWSWSDEIDTNAPAMSREQGLAIAADADTVSVLGSDGHYIASHDGGRTWISEIVPFGTNVRLGLVSLTEDRFGHPLAAASVLVNQPGGAGRWMLRLARRVGASAWQLLPGPTDGRVDCAAQVRSAADMTCDRFRVLEDPSGAMHAVWQGGSDDDVAAYYAWRPSGGNWQPPLRLVAPDPVRGLTKSFADDLLLDQNSAVVLASFELHYGWRYRGNDAELEPLRNDAMRAPPLPVSRFIRDAMTESEPEVALSASALSFAPHLLHAADGRVWGDVLMILRPSSIAAPGVVVWQHLDVTDWLGKADQ